MRIMEEALAGKPLSCDVIDAHSHITLYTKGGWYQYRPELENVIQMMDRMGVDTIVTAPHTLVGSYCELGNQITKKAIAEYPGRVLGYIIINPNFGMKEAKSIIKKYIDEDGFVGFKYLSGYHGTLLSEPYGYGFSVANEHRMPVLCHTWNENPPLSEFRTLASKYPDMSLIVAHGGGNRNTYLAFAKLCSESPNVFIEICGGLMCDLWLEDIVAAAGADRIIFGTDTINLDPRNDFGRIVFADIPENDKKKILAGNFKRIMGRRS